ncbi:hypothetical protein [Acetobacter syzygii]|mgnify:CR=1 FL=1|uniref:Uncharacterized protein n=1 Tax=Acetobacter syzygii TaxID=146476 RepID=A0A270BNE1_9PROT|nr:hypothetical protein [Acetobacter syzygii]NSL92331.1 hypothetical protein [Acetobacter syzygii]PAL26518.1 hypothetical protein B9K05_05815 [Acetobacter syzygii]PAL26702.1 hypothetical protein B9K04_05310 [Acetobacter syzygii]GAN70856.1 hypothetical protein Absy_009_148 [Acetobacter syzygii]GBR62681.1 hypothetical protein AA0483_0489 [Acetobacter syzygii NRIC 0483]
MQSTFPSLSLLPLFVLTACAASAPPPNTPQAESALYQAKQTCLDTYQTRPGQVAANNMGKLMNCLARATQKYGRQAYGPYAPIYMEGASKGVEAAQHLREGLYTPDQFGSEIGLIQEQENSAIQQKKAQINAPLDPILQPVPANTTH